jgi:hypothetical protein
MSVFNNIVIHRPHSRASGGAGNALLLFLEPIDYRNFPATNHSLLGVPGGQPQMNGLSKKTRGVGIASRKATMQLTIRTKVTYGFLILAFGMLLTDFCKLVRASSDAALTATASTQHARKF